MISTMKKFYCFLLAFLPLSVFADTASTKEVPAMMLNFFRPSSGDLSIRYLGELFGTVGGVSILHGTSGQLLGQIFGIMNNGIIIVMGAFFCYSLFYFVINTAHDGEMLAKGKSSLMLAFRTAGGLGLAIPSKVTGYCLAQTIVMWAVVQGVGMADSAWSRVLDYLQNEGGQVYATSPISAENMLPLVPSAKNVLIAETCMYKLKNMSQEQQAKEKAANAQVVEELGTTSSPLLPLTGSISKVGYAFNEANSTVYFGSKNPKHLTDASAPEYLGECGTISWSPPTSSQTVSKYKDGRFSSEEKKFNSSKYRQLALQQMILDLAPAAKKLAATNTPEKGDNVNAPSEVSKALFDAIVHYSNIVMPAIKLDQKLVNEYMADQLQAAREKGWLMAGSYYRYIANVNQEGEVEFNNYLPTVGLPQYNNSVLWGQLDDGQKARLNTIQIQTFVNVYMPTVEGLLVINAADKGNTGLSKKLVDSLRNGIHTSAALASGAIFMAAGGPVGAGISAPAIGIVWAFSGTVTSIIDTWEKTINQPGDPLIALQGFGKKANEAAQGLWVLVLQIIIMGSMALSIMSSVQPFAATFSETGKWVLPVVGTVLTALFTIGMVFSVFVPLIPAFVFGIAGIGWLIAVLEMMAAAPLVALGITHPESHDLLGKAEQGIMVIFTVFLRPILLLIGLLAAMMLTMISMKIINAGFMTVVESTSGSGNRNMAAILTLLVVYTGFMAFLVQAIFGKIVPGLASTVERIIGLQGIGEFSSDKALDTMHTSAQSTGQDIAKGADTTIQGVQGDGTAVARASARGAREARGDGG